VTERGDDLLPPRPSEVDRAFRLGLVLVAVVAGALLGLCGVLAWVVAQLF